MTTDQPLDVDAELAQAHAVIAATRQMAIDANAGLRAQLLEALGREDDGRTPLSAYVSHLAVQRDALKASLSRADAEIELLRAVADAAIAWRQWIASDPVVTLYAGARENALIEAVDKLTEGENR